MGSSFACFEQYVKRVDHINITCPIFNRMQTISSTSFPVALTFRVPDLSQFSRGFHRRKKVVKQARMAVRNSFINHVISINTLVIMSILNMCLVV